MERKERYILGTMLAAKEAGQFWLKLQPPPYSEVTFLVKPSPRAEEGSGKPTHDLWFKGNRVGALWTKTDDKGEVFYTGRVLFFTWPGLHVPIGVFRRNDGEGFIVSVTLPEAAA